MVTNTSIVDEPVYRIGAVARLTGIPTVTLRMWERRYGVVDPKRSQGRNRLYSREDIARLALIKRLVDEGNAISTVAPLSLDQLQERARFQTTPTSALPCRVMILGDALPARVSQYHPDLDGLEIIATHRDLQGFEAEAEALHPNVIVVEYPTIDEGTVSGVERLLTRSGAQHAVVVYGFGRLDAVRQLDTARITPLRAPVGLPELRRACLADGIAKASPLVGFEQAPSISPETVIPPRRYSNETLASLAAAPTTVHCECPKHLADLLFGLTAFEQYSEQCQIRSPDDAALHAYLHATTARARALIEEALARVVEAERLDD